MSETHAPLPDASGHAPLRGGLILRALAVGALGGIVLGLAWCLLAPRVQAVVTESAQGDRSVDFLQPQPGQFIAAQLVLAILLFAGGLVHGLFLARVRPQDWDVVLGAVLGGAIAGVVAWTSGEWLDGLVHGVDLSNPSVLALGSVYDLPLRLRGLGSLAAWPLSAALVLLMRSIGEGADESQP